MTETLFIDGAWRGAQDGETFVSSNPATGELLSAIADGGAADAQAALDAAVKAFTTWSRTTAYERAELLYRAHGLMTERHEELAQVMTTEQGKPIRAARNEVRYAADFLLWFAEEAKRVYGATIPSSRADQRFLTLRQPVGVVAAITPWNYPISMLTRKMGPALAAGCTVVLKPAPQTPLCAVEMFRVFEDAGFPAGTVNLVTTDRAAAVADVWLDSPEVRKLTFTGSTEVGKQLGARAMATMKRVSLELGGHAPFIVCADANAEHAAKGAALVKFLNTGQACISPNRIYVHRSKVDEFVSVLVSRVGKLKAGNGLEDGVSIGPLIDDRALAKMERQVGDARGKGAQVLAGGSRLVENGLDRGMFYGATVLTDVTPEMDIFTEETFGPIAPVLPFDDEAEVIEQANKTLYGLASYVYTNDLSRALRFAEALRFGIIGINDINPTSAAAPFGGIKESGLGREGAAVGIDEYLDVKLVGIALSQ